MGDTARVDTARIRLRHVWDDRGITAISRLERDAMCDEIDTLRQALKDADHSPYCASLCPHKIHDCDCGWQEAVNPYLPTADDVCGILAGPAPGTNAAALAPFGDPA